MISRPTACSTNIPRFGRPPGRKARWKLVAVDGRSLNGLIFAATVLLGLLLLPARLCARTFVVGAAMIALVLAGVFAPTFSRQILGGVLASAVFVVAVMWTMGMCRPAAQTAGANRRPKRPAAASTAWISRSISRSRLRPSPSPPRRRSGRRTGPCVRHICQSQPFVPKLCKWQRLPATLCVDAAPPDFAERRTVGSHAERGNQGIAVVHSSSSP